MKHRLREGASERTAAAARLRRSVRQDRPPVCGQMRNVIVVKPPDPRFREAIFVLREDYFLSEELSRQELLLQAKDAAQNYVNSICPRRHSSPLLLLLFPAVFVLGALLFVGLL